MNTAVHSVQYRRYGLEKGSVAFCTERRLLWLARPKKGSMAGNLISARKKC